jgi:hypothetical protein
MNNRRHIWIVARTKRSVAWHNFDANASGHHLEARHGQRKITLILRSSENARKGARDWVLHQFEIPAMNPFSRSREKVARSDG